MKLTRQIIKENLKKFPKFQYYIDVPIIKAESNVEEFPDVAIDACKCLIEGVSKSMLNRLDPTFDEKRATKQRGGKSVQQLFKMALERIEELGEGFESGYVHSTGHIINMTQSMRTARGDLSHGKSVPKAVNSTPAFARLMLQMTDLTVSYVLEHFFKIDVDYRDYKPYDSEEFVAYNSWLDSTIENFPIKTVNYSLLLHKHDYEAYINQFWDEYIFTLDTDEDGEPIGVPEEALPEPVGGPDTKLPEPVGGPETPPLEPIGEPDIKLPEPVDGPEIPPLEPVGEPETRPDDLPISPPETEPVDSEPEVIPVIWTDDQEAALVALVDDMDLKLPFARQVVQLYLFDGRPPLTDEIIKTLPQKPRLKERRAVVEATTKRLVDLAKQLKPTPPAEQ